MNFSIEDDAIGVGGVGFNSCIDEDKGSEVRRDYIYIFSNLFVLSLPALI